MATFLDSAELVALTGRKTKSKQIEALRTMGLPFWINPIGKPVVATVAIEGRKTAPVEPDEPVWVMPRVKNGTKKHA